MIYLLEEWVKTRWVAARWSKTKKRLDTRAAHLAAMGFPARVTSYLVADFVPHHPTKPGAWENRDTACHHYPRCF